MQNQKTIVSTLLWILFLVLLLVWGRYIVQLSNAIHSFQQEVKEVSVDYQVLLGKIEAEQNAHGAAELHMEELNARIIKLEELVKEQDTILTDMYNSGL